MLLEVDVDQEAAVRWLHEIGDRLESPAALEIVSDEMSDYMAEVFATANFGTWAPLSPSTLATKGNSQILVDTGGLLDSLTGAGRGRREGDSVTITTDERSAGYLKRGARGMPQRDPAPAPRAGEIHEWAEQLLGFLVHGRIR